MSDEWVWGRHAVAAVLRQRPQDVRALHSAEGRQPDAEIHQRATLAGIAVQTCSRTELDQRFPGDNHQGWAALCRPAQVLPEAALSELLSDQTDPLLLVLDGVTDPHNLGACLRTAEVAGVLAVVIPKDRAVGLTPVVRKVSSGASERLPLIAVTNLARTLDQLKARGIWVAGLAGEAGDSLYGRDLCGPLALVMGSEGGGLRRLTRERCDFLLAIPMQGDTGSLNVSVATGIALFEAVRQRGLQ